MFPPGTRASELRALLPFFEPPAQPGGGNPFGGRGGRAGQQLPRTFGRSSPWTATFRGGTRISNGLVEARRVIERDGVEPTVVLVSDLDDSTLTVRRLGPSSVAMYASPSYLARRGTPKTPKDLERHEWVVYSRRTELRLEGGGRPVTVPTRGRIRCDDFAFLRAAMVQGCGIGYLPPYVADDDLATGRLVRVLPRWQSPISNAWAVWP